MKIILKRDSRRFNYQNEFGSTTQFLPSLFVGGDTLNDIQPIGNVMCTVYTVDKVKSGETGKKYDHNWLWAKMVQAGKTSFGGAAPQDAFAMAVKGQKVLGSDEIDTSEGYFQTDIGQFDFFTNVKSAIQMEYNKGLKRPQGVGTNWYDEWINKSILPMGKKIDSDHEWDVVGWDEAHPNCFQIDAHLGYEIWIPQEVFNAAMDATYASVALTLAETTEERIEFLKSVQVSLLQRLIDVIYNTVKQLNLITLWLKQ